MPSPTRGGPRSLAAAALLALVAGCGTAADAGSPVAAPVPSSASSPAPTPSAPAPAPSSAPASPPPAASPSTTPAQAAPAPPAPLPGTALAALATLPVKGRAPRTGYDRDLFGQAWADVDRNGCDTRNDVLRRDLVDVVLDARTGGCVVLSGLLADPFTGASVPFTRGVATSADVQVDHLVALSDAWQKGAQQWSADEREAFANDPLNLLAVDGPTNAAKGDGDAATWLPPQRAVRCAYVARQVAVKATYGAWVTAAERDAVARVLEGCPDELLPTAEGVATPPRGAGLDIAAVAEREPAVPAPEPEPEPEPAPAPAPAGGSGADPRFGSCREALAAGYGEYVRGVDPEYDWYRDGDGDGVVCEG
ncbi:DUF1524 domain-containing protein [uncultured Pseudokineococcus sp.]|uniref:GmrSD restriction endonuclease domain-containing protein n=1 Tax=uncultured Pseudokineococcus sp. TaxID=1642928 RepID=UPI002618983B|nr:DUF1524 domain-containing protein [uncultured Pseudokineococcus sp.]